MANMLENVNVQNFLKNSGQFNCSVQTRDLCTTTVSQNIKTVMVIQVITQYKESRVCVYLRIGSFL